MNLILQAIKSLFRGLENHISAKIAGLNSKINNVQISVKTAQKAANNAQKTATAAKTAAMQVTVPVCQAVSTDGEIYELNIGREVKNGELIVIIPNMTSQSVSVRLKINGMFYSVYRHGNNGTSDSNDLPRAKFFWAEHAVPVILERVDQYNIGYACLVGYNREQVTQFCCICTSDASDPVKVIPETDGINSMVDGGVIVYAKFQKGNTASNPKLQVGGFEVPIADRFGSPISADAIKTGGFYQFVYFSSKFVLMD